MGKRGRSGRAVREQQGRAAALDVLSGSSARLCQAIRVSAKDASTDLRWVATQREIER